MTALLSRPASITTARPTTASTTTARSHLLDALAGLPLPQQAGEVPAYLGRVVAVVAAHPTYWEDFVRFQDGSERYRVRLPLPVEAEVWLITWRTFQGTDLHDHGLSDSAFATVRGALHEVRPVQGRLIPRKIIPGIVHHIPAGRIHDVRNELAGPAVSIHAYSPQLEVTTYYSWRDGGAHFERTEIGPEAEASGWR